MGTQVLVILLAVLGFENGIVSNHCGMWAQIYRDPENPSRMSILEGSRAVKYNPYGIWESPTIIRDERNETHGNAFCRSRINRGRGDYRVLLYRKKVSSKPYSISLNRQILT
jgi:hypothetical protein